MSDSNPRDRRTFLGGSDIAALYEVSPWTTLYRLWEEKTAAEPTPDDPSKQKIYNRGKKFEPLVMQMAEEERGIFIVRRNQRYDDAEFAFFSCEIDFEFMDDAGMCNGDVKTVSPFHNRGWGDVDTDEVPLHYCLQFLWGLMITGRPYTLVALLCGSDDLRFYVVKRDEELIADMRAKALHFWNHHVLGRIPPAAKTVADLTKAIARHKGFAIPATERALLAISRLRGIKAALTKLNSLEKQYQADIREQLLLAAETAGAIPSDKYMILGTDGQPLVTLAEEHRSAYSVAATSFYTLRLKKAK